MRLGSDRIFPDDTAVADFNPSKNLVTMRFCSAAELYITQPELTECGLTLVLIYCTFPQA